jgi:hypothetical protein
MVGLCTVVHIIKELHMIKAYGFVLDYTLSEEHGSVKDGTFKFGGSLSRYDTNDLDSLIAYLANLKTKIDAKNESQS